jgi:hypothetical protein
MWMERPAGLRMYNYTTKGFVLCVQSHDMKIVRHGHTAMFAVCDVHKVSSYKFQDAFTVGMRTHTHTHLCGCLWINYVLVPSGVGILKRQIFAMSRELDVLFVALVYITAQGSVVRCALLHLGQPTDRRCPASLRRRFWANWKCKAQHAEYARGIQEEELNELHWSMDCVQLRRHRWRNVGGQIRQPCLYLKFVAVGEVCLSAVGRHVWSCAVQSPLPEPGRNETKTRLTATCKCEAWPISLLGNLRRPAAVCFLCPASRWPVSDSFTGTRQFNIAVSSTDGNV